MGEYDTVQAIILHWNVSSLKSKLVTYFNNSFFTCQWVDYLGQTQEEGQTRPDKVVQVAQEPSKKEPELRNYLWSQVHLASVRAHQYVTKDWGFPNSMIKNTGASYQANEVFQIHVTI